MKVRYFLFVIVFFLFAGVFYKVHAMTGTPIGIIAPEPPIAIDDNPPTVAPTQTQSTPSCTQRPACLDAKPRCMVAQPESGWCPAPITPEPQETTPQPTLIQNDPNPTPPPGCYYKPGMCPMIACTQDYCPPCRGILVCPGTPYPTIIISPSVTNTPVICKKDTCISPTVDPDNKQTPVRSIHAVSPIPGLIHKKPKPHVNPILSTFSSIWSFITHIF